MRHAVAPPRRRKLTSLKPPSVTVDDRRASVRHACTIEGSCGPVSLRRCPPSWSVLVRDISLEGIALVMNGYLEVGTFLTVHLPAECGRPLPLRVKIVRTQRVAARTWVLGCTIHPGLSAEELKQWIDGAR